MRPYDLQTFRVASNLNPYKELRGRVKTALQYYINASEDRLYGVQIGSSNMDPYKECTPMTSTLSGELPI